MTLFGNPKNDVNRETIRKKIARGSYVFTVPRTVACYTELDHTYLSITGRFGAFE